MEISNWIDETERHAELYDAFTPRQRHLLRIVDEDLDDGEDHKNLRSELRDLGVSEAEINWLERIGRLVR